jgi:hypothetical protein
MVVWLVFPSAVLAVSQIQFVVSTTPYCTLNFIILPCLFFFFFFGRSTCELRKRSFYAVSTLFVWSVNRAVLPRVVFWGRCALPVTSVRFLADTSIKFLSDNLQMHLLMEQLFVALSVLSKKCIQIALGNCRKHSECSSQLEVVWESIPRIETKGGLWIWSQRK